MNLQNRFIFLFVLSVLISPLSVIAQSISDAHIESNVPDDKDFKKFLARDIQKYFSIKLNKAIRIEYELLRDSPTQSGIAYPKYYLWVKVFDDNTIIEESAVRIAAIGKVRFEVIEYVSKSEIIREPKKIETIFPAGLCDNIRSRACAKL